MIQWYFGYIVKVEQQFKCYFDKVDLVIEVCDVCIFLVMGYFYFNCWLKGKQYLMVINRCDMVIVVVKEVWEVWFKVQGQWMVWCDVKVGIGVKQVQQVVICVGDYFNECCCNWGMCFRLVWVFILGFFNVGKLVLINCLVCQKVVVSVWWVGVM